MTAESSYPLQWPPGREKTEPGLRERSAFRTTQGKARDEALRELQR